MNHLPETKWRPLRPSNDTKSFIARLQSSLDRHYAVDSGGPMEISPEDLARLLSLARESHKLSPFSQENHPNG